MTNLEVGDIVLCTVEKIDGTLVFVKIDGGGSGSITFSEVSPGRIRNIRDFVVPKKSIVCKVIRILPGNIELSLRRVTPKEQKEIRDQKKQEKSFQNVVKTIMGEKSTKVLEQMEKEGNISQVLSSFKEEPQKLEKLFGKENVLKISEILNEQKTRKIKVKKEIFLSTTKPEGLSLIKKVLSSDEIEVKYIAAGKYSLEIESEDPKLSNNKIRDFLEHIEEESKKMGLNLVIK